MVETPETPSQITPSGRLIRFLVGGLPLGLVIMGALSFVLYFQKKNKPLAQPTEFAAMMQRDLNEADFQRNLRILSQDIGERTIRRQDNEAAAAAFIESTMGPENMGYGVARADFSAEGRSVASLVAALPGAALTDEAILVLASQDTTEANAVAESAGAASLLCLAHSMAGNPSRRTILFGSAARMDAARQDANGCWQMAQLGEVKARKITAIIVLGAEGAAPALQLPPSWQGATLLPRSIDLVRPLESLKTLATEIKALADAS